MALHLGPIGPNCPCDRCQERTWTGSGTAEDPYLAVSITVDAAELREQIDKLGQACMQMSGAFGEFTKAMQPAVDAVDEENRDLLADILGCDPDLIDDVVAVWAKR